MNPGKIERIVVEVLELLRKAEKSRTRSRVETFSGEHGEPVPTGTERMIDARLARLTGRLNAQDRQAVLKAISFRTGGHLDAPERVMIARYQLAGLIGDVEQAMITLAKLESPIVEPIGCRGHTCHSGSRPPAIDRAAITALREFCERHGAWSIFIDRETHALDEHWRHLEAVVSHGDAALELTMRDIAEEEARKHLKAAKPHAVLIDKQLEAQGVTPRDVAAMRGETGGAGDARKRRNAQTPEQQRKRRDADKKARAKAREKAKVISRVRRRRSAA